MCYCSVSFMCSSVSEVIGQMSAKQQQRTTKCTYYYYALVAKWASKTWVSDTYVTILSWVIWVYISSSVKMISYNLISIKVGHLLLDLC